MSVWIDLACCWLYLGGLFSIKFGSNEISLLNAGSASNVKKLLPGSVWESTGWRGACFYRKVLLVIFSFAIIFRKALCVFPVARRTRESVAKSGNATDIEGLTATGMTECVWGAFFISTGLMLRISTLKGRELWTYTWYLVLGTFSTRRTRVVGVVVVG